MGAILATPGKTTRQEVPVERNNNNTSTSNNNNYNDNNNNNNNNNNDSNSNNNNNNVNSNSNNNNTSNNNNNKTEYAGKPYQKQAFNKFNIVQECFPSLASKENRFFNEKVPSYWSKTKSDAKKKSKQKIIPAEHVCSVNRSESVKPTSGNNSAAFIAYDTDENTKKETVVQKISPVSSAKHYYGTLNLSETLKYIGCYVYLRCRNLEGLKPSIVVGWVRGIDRNLVLSGWQEIGFISQPNMIVLYMLLREVIPPKVRSTSQLKAIMMSTLYMCYAYNGHEISYPLKPFIFDGDRASFWTRCLEIINSHSDKLLRANKDPKYYNEIQVELKTFGRSLERKEK